MEIVEGIKKVFQELVVPELEQIKNEYAELKAMINITNKRLDDMNSHLIDQSRRIDETNKRIDYTNTRIDETNKRIDETNKKIDELRVELKQEIADNTSRIDDVNLRIDRLYEVVIKREEHNEIVFKIYKLEQEVEAIKTKMAA